MKWKTSISHTKDEVHQVRGVPLTDLVAQQTFTEAIYFILTGKRATSSQARMLDAVLVAMLDHGVGVPTAFVPRTVASVGAGVIPALASGLLAIGEHHGGAIEAAMRVFGKAEDASIIVAQAKAAKARLPGYGHKVYTDVDPRSAALFLLAKEQGVYGVFVQKAVEIEKELNKHSLKKLPLNIDGSVAAILCELGFSPVLGKAFFALGRRPGMMAQVQEELQNEKPYRRFENEEIEFLG